MITKETINFLKKLKNNNNKVWMDANRKEYLTAKENFEDFVNDILKGLSKNTHELYGTLTAKQCCFRINRDVRFSANKSPYKTNMGASLNKYGKKSETAGGYIHIEPGAIFCGGGIYMPMPNVLNSIRQEIDYNFDEWLKIVKDKKTINYFGNELDGISNTVRPPKGYQADNPAIEYLKMKNYIFTKSFTDEAILNKNSVSEIVKTINIIEPFIDFMNRAILDK